jgi:GDP-D-mannose dehydratase
MTRTALITGVTGQDGSYLAEFLLRKGYEVHGLVRRASSLNRQRLDSIYRDPHEGDVPLRLHYSDLSDAGPLVNLIRDLRPDEIYHLGAQSHVKVSFELPEYTADVTGLGTIRILEAIRASGVPARFYQASSSEMFGSAPVTSDRTREVGLDWQGYVEIDPNYYRAAEVDYLMGDASKARRVLGWEPQTRFEDLVRIMVESDIRLLEDELSGKLALAGHTGNRWIAGD